MYLFIARYSQLPTQIRQCELTQDWKTGWQRKLFWLMGIRASQNLHESDKSSYWAGDVLKNTVKSWNSQMHFHSVEIFPWDINCRKRHHSESTLLHVCACAMCSQSPTSATLSHFWLLGSKYECEMGPKTKTNTYEFTEFSLVLTQLYLAIKMSDTNSVTEWIYSPLSKTVFQSLFMFVTNSQTAAIIA